MKCCLVNINRQEVERRIAELKAQLSATRAENHKMEEFSSQLRKQLQETVEENARMTADRDTIVLMADVVRYVAFSRYCTAAAAVNMKRRSTRCVFSCQSVYSWTLGSFQCFMNGHSRRLGRNPNTMTAIAAIRNATQKRIEQVWTAA